MSEKHTNDQTAIEWPEFPYDHGEIFDYVLRKGPVSRREINHPMMSPNEVAMAIEWCKDNGYIKTREGDLEEDGTTETLYYVPKSMEVGE